MIHTIDHLAASAFTREFSSALSAQPRAKAAALEAAIGRRMAEAVHAEARRRAADREGKGGHTPGTGTIAGRVRRALQALADGAVTSSDVWAMGGISPSSSGSCMSYLRARGYATGAPGDDSRMRWAITEAGRAALRVPEPATTRGGDRRSQSRRMAASGQQDGAGEGLA
jgi:hypothetical protein